MSVAVSIVAAGTSLTTRGGWTESVRTELENFFGPVRLECVAKAGASSYWGVQQISTIVALRPDFVLIEFAINDAAIHRGVGLRQSRRNVECLVTGIRKNLPFANVILMTTNPVWGWKSWVRPRLDLYYEQYREIATRLGVEFIDGNDRWNQMTRASLLAAIPDGTHPLPDQAIEVLSPEIVRTILRLRRHTAQ